MTKENLLAILDKNEHKIRVIMNKHQCILEHFMANVWLYPPSTVEHVQMLLEVKRDTMQRLEAFGPEAAKVEYINNVIHVDFVNKKRLNQKAS